MTSQMTTGTPAAPARPDPAGRSFIEVQFPVSKLSKECYKERKAGASQTLTGLGKWWGRKPLTLVRALILGLLLPATEDADGDRETFLALMTMDDEGLWRRLNGNLPARIAATHASPRERDEFFDISGGKVGWKRGLSVEQRRSMQRRAFFRMSYDERLAHCKRPEEIDGPSPEAWERINAHLGTTANSLPELVRELGERRFGHRPRVGDAFCGGGSIPFEAARIGCEAYGSDLNPVAALLTWGALNIVGGGEEVVERVAQAQKRVFDAVQRQVDKWGIERNADGWIADAYLYCNEVVDPATGWTVPLAPSWVIATKTNVIARLVPDPATKRFEIEIAERVTPQELADAATEGTTIGGVRCPVDADGRWLQPAMRQVTTFEALRGRQGLRRWENDDLVARQGDTLVERLYCIRWIDPRTGNRYFRAPTEDDLRRERYVLQLLRERFPDWQASGVIPFRQIEPGDKTDEPIRTRGWTHWHHLFNPRQLLIHGLFNENAKRESDAEAVALMLLVGRLANWDSRLTTWRPPASGGLGAGAQTFYNQAINTLLSYSCRAMATLDTLFLVRFPSYRMHTHNEVEPLDARSISHECDCWITDPGYADAIKYEELSEYFLAWYDERLTELFPNWYNDSRRALAVTGTGEQFRVTLAECYARMAENMAVDGYQIVMFTHQDPAVWSDLALVLWSAGLQVSAAWTIQTETGATGVRQGNLVQGTVCLVLRKRQGERYGDLMDLYPDIQDEVQRQLDSMTNLDPKEDRNFGDADYQLAAYAAALRVLTGYSRVGEIDVERELRRTRGRGEKSPLEDLIARAVRIASDHLVPAGLGRTVWRGLGPEERLYLKGIEVEAGGEAREGVYQELARGYGALDYRDLLASRTANAARLKTPSELGGVRGTATTGFAASPLRHVLYAIHATAGDTNRNPDAARGYLRRTLPDYWTRREDILAILTYLEHLTHGLPHWSADTHAARILRVAVEGDRV